MSGNLRMKFTRLKFSPRTLLILSLSIASAASSLVRDESGIATEFAHGPGPQ
jgi:hypothetical protein